MAKFLFEARTITGKIMTGTIESRDEAEAKVKLRAKQLIPIKLRVVQTQKALERKKSTDDGLFAPRVNSKQMQIFTRQFATLINSGIPILDALKILAQGSTDKLLKEALVQVVAAIESGRKLSDAMAMHPRVFDGLYCNMIRAGEEAGILDTILLRLSSYSEKNEKIKGQVKSALTMPVFILIAAFAVITGIIVFVIPKFEEIYKSSGKELPGLTQLVVNISHTITNQWYIVIGVIIGIIVIVMSYARSKEGRRNIHRIMINAPVVGDVVQKVAVARMSRTMSTLLTSGINMLEAIDIAAKTAGNLVIEEALGNCKQSVMVGKPFHQPLSRQKEIPKMVTQMVSIGEQSGTLDTMLGKVADFYEDEVENAIKAMTQLIEPVMMFGLGGIIAFVMIAMYLPIFQLGDTIG